MPTRPSATPQPDAVNRRLSLLSEELAAVREVTDSDDDPEPHTRIRPLSVVPDAHTHVPSVVLTPSEPSSPPALPEPGRHAARPSGAGVGRLLADRMPDTLRGRVRLTPAQLALVTLVVAAGLALAAWWTVRSGSSGEPVPAAAPAAPAASVVGLETAGPESAGASVSPTAGAAPTTVVVDVVGAVRKPGIVVLETGSRVVDAIEAAGGARKRVDLSTLNQARLLVDGEQIVVGVPVAPGVAGSAAPSASATTLVNINTATLEQLEELPGVGPVTAQAILDWRTTNGGFTSVEELLEVDGIGDATLADLAPFVTI
jgi:competence protein ComEA